MCKVKIGRAVRYPVGIQASLLLVVPVQVKPTRILPQIWLIAIAEKIADMMRIS